MTTKDFCLACKATFHDECQEMWAGNLADSDFCCCGGDFSLEGDKAPVEGPDKNTMRNVEDNVHRICAECHNRWHGANDKYYGERPMTPDGKVDASVPFHPVDDDGKQMSPIPHDAITLAPDEQVHAEDKRRRDESRKHGTIPKADD